MTPSTPPEARFPPTLTFPVEEPRRGGWWIRCLKTLGRLVRHPWRSFAVCPEPIEHGKVLRFLASLRFPPWILLASWVLVRDLAPGREDTIPMRAIHSFIEAPLVEALSTWLIIMVPVGMPLLYFVLGMLAHIGIGLTGGASRSLGATMRALGFALAVPLLVIAVLDGALYLWPLPGLVVLPLIGVVALIFGAFAGVGIARTHRISLVRAALAVLLPVALFAAVHGGRAALQVQTIPGTEPPSSQYYVP